MDEYAENDTTNINAYRITHRKEDGGDANKDFREYDGFKYLYGNESEHAIHNALKQKAINASHEHVIDPDNTEKRELFNLSQYNLREFRGRYIAKNVKSDQYNTVFGYTPQTNSSGNKYTTVEFKYTHDGNNCIPIPIVTKVDEVLDLFKSADNQDTESVDANKVVKIISKSLARTLKKFSSDVIKKDLLSEMFKEVKLDIEKYPDASKLQTLGADADRWDDVARKEKMCGNWTVVKFKHDGKDVRIVYRCDINLIIPSKIKVEHNVKTVHRFALDFTKILNPIHVDLIIMMSEHVFTWTMYEFENSKHQIYHAGYFTEDARLFDMPGTLSEMTKRFNDGTDTYIDPFFSKAAIDTSRIDRNDYISMLNLQVHALKEKLKIDGSDHVFTDQASYHTDVGYIYKYNQYTIIASGIKYPFQNAPDATGSKHQYINFYTIIHWNNTPSFVSTTVLAPKAGTPPKTHDGVQADISALYTYIKGVDSQIGQLVANRITVPQTASSKVDFFIPAIMLDHTKKYNEISIKENPIGVYYLSQCTKEDKDVIDLAINWEKIRLLKEEYGLEQDVRQHIYIKDEMIRFLEYHYSYNKHQKTNTVQGLFGYLLKTVHSQGNPITKITDTPTKSGLEVWSDFWHEYFEKRPQFNGIVSFKLENSNELKILMARNEDSATRRYKQKWDEMRRIQQEEKNRYRQAESQRRRYEESDKYYNIHFPSQPTITESTQSSAKSHGRQGNIINPGNVSVVHAGDRRPKTFSAKRDKKQDRSSEWFGSNFYRYIPRNSLAAAVSCPEFIPQDSPNITKMQAEIDTLKRTLNELTLKAQV